MSYTIKPIQKKHNLGAAQMIRAVFEEFKAPKEGTVYSDPELFFLFEEFEKTDRSFMYVLLSNNNEVVGTCGIYPTNQLPEGCVELVKFYLAPKARGKGWGKNLLHRCMEEAKKLGYSSVYIESLPAFKRALNLYEKSGFTYLTSALGASGHSGCNLWMIKEL